MRVGALAGVCSVCGLRKNALGARKASKSVAFQVASPRRESSALLFSRALLSALCGVPPLVATGTAEPRMIPNCGDADASCQDAADFLATLPPPALECVILLFECAGGLESIIQASQTAPSPCLDDSDGLAMIARYSCDARSSCCNGSSASMAPLGYTAHGIATPASSMYDGTLRLGLDESDDEGGGARGETSGAGGHGRHTAAGGRSSGGGGRGGSPLPPPARGTATATATAMAPPLAARLSPSRPPLSAPERSVKK